MNAGNRNFKRGNGRADRVFPLFATVAGAAALAALFATVYGSADPPTPFPHATHLDQGLECLDCHAAIPESEHLEGALFPKVEVCVDCHETEDLKAYGYDPMPEVPGAILDFSHVLHLTQESVTCATCHADHAGTAAAEGAERPGHAVCGACHVEVDAESSCNLCHLNLAALKPLDHRGDFVHEHQFEARDQGSCAACHRQEASCTRCHHGENISFLSHDRTWLYTHAEDARKGITDCSACHESRTFCAPCHQDEGVRPTDHLVAAEWLEPGNRHAEEARRDITVCASCHETSDPLCVTCHRDADNILGTDSRLDIHPDGWRDLDWKGPWHDDDGATCFLCHDSSSRRTKVGFCTYCHALD